jgi:Asp/Glu/hydantoin racemase
LAESQDHGFDSNLVSIRPINLPVLSKDEEEVKGALLREGKKAVEDGADVIVLGWDFLVWRNG